MDDYEFKAMLSEISTVERGLTLAEVVRRKAAVIIRRLARQPHEEQVESRSWTDMVVDRMIIIGLVDRDSRLPTPIMALLGLLIGAMFVEASLALVFAEVSIVAVLGWIALLLAYGYLWLGVGATAVMRIRMRRAGELA